MNQDLLRIRRMQAQEKANFLRTPVYLDTERDVIREDGNGERFNPRPDDEQARIADLENRLGRVERLLTDIYNLSNVDTFPPELVERLKEFAYR